MTSDKATDREGPVVGQPGEPAASSAWRRAALVLGIVMLAALALHSVLPTGPSAGARGPVGPVLPYRGRLAGDPSYLALVDRLPGWLTSARQVVVAATGLPDNGDAQIRFVDRNAGLARRSFMARTVHGPRGGPAIIELDTAVALSGRIAVKQLLVHEMVHVLLSRAVGEGYPRLPAWLREGLAVRVARQDSSRLDRTISSIPGRPAADLVVRLAIDRHDASDYALDSLAIEKLEDLAGDDSLPRLCACLVSEGKWSDCRRALTGLNASAFEETVLEYARRRIDDRAGDRAERFVGGLGLLGHGHPASALKVFDDLIALGEGPYDREALLQSARCLVALERPAAAGDRLALLRALGTMGPALAREAAKLRVEVLRATGQKAAAARACERVWWYHEGRVSPDECQVQYGA